VVEQPEEAGGVPAEHPARDRDVAASQRAAAVCGCGTFAEAMVVPTSG
jgi:hypothetical protein